MNHSLNPTLARLLTLCRMNRSWTRGEGVWLFDEEGRRFLDCYAQYGAVALGHNAPCVTDAVHAALAGREPAMVQPYRAPYAEQLANALTRLAPGDLSCCVFSTSGAEAVEAAIKLVRARTRRPIILSATGSFHGKTLGALALTGQDHHAEGFGPLPSGFERVEFGDADALAARLARDGERIAALFLEPIQGERGVHLPPPGYLAAVRELCTRHGVALVFDEVQTGLGRTGRMFACEHDGVAPDLMVLGKALGGGLFPLSACLASEAMWDEGFGVIPMCVGSATAALRGRRMTKHEPLRLLAEDEDDLEVISAALQDAIAKVGDIEWDAQAAAVSRWRSTATSGRCPAACSAIGCGPGCSSARCWR